MKNFTITTTNGTVSYTLAKGSVPTIKAGALVFETKDGTKTVPAAGILDTSIETVSFTGKRDQLAKELTDAQTLVVDIRGIVFSRAKAANVDTDVDYRSALDGYVRALDAVQTAKVALRKHDKMIAAGKAWSAKQRAEKAASKAPASVASFTEDKPIADMTPLPPVEAPKAKTPKSKK